MIIAVAIFLAIICIILAILTTVIYKFTTANMDTTENWYNPVIMKKKMKEVVVGKKRGAIFIPPSDTEELRQELIERNKAAGLDTPINDLIENEE